MNHHQDKTQPQELEDIKSLKNRIEELETKKRDVLICSKGKIRQTGERA